MALKHSYFFRPTSRPSSPAPGPAGTAPPTPGDERAPRPATKLAFTGFRRASPAPAPVPNGAPATLVQDGSYLEALSLKLSEAVSKALAQPTGPAAPPEQLAGRRPIPAGRGAQLGALIASELNAAAGNVNLRRAILRSLQRPMSVLLTNLSTNLLPLISAPAFLAPAAPSVSAPSPNPTQLHALAYATFAGELIEAFNDMGLGLDSDMRGDGLKAVREDLASMVKRVVGPLAQGIKNELCPLLEALESPAAAPASAPASGAKGPKLPAPAHPSIGALQAVLPVHAKALGRYAATPTAQALVASVVICLVWRALVAIAHRAPPAPSPPPTPKLSPLKKPRTLSSTTPPTTPPASRFTLKLPPSRPPSPPGASSVHRPSTPAGDARLLFDLLNALPRPTPERETARLAREAVDEAFAALLGLASLLVLVHSGALLAHSDAEAAEAELEQAAADVPTLLALPVLLRALGGPGCSRSVPGMLGMEPEAYRVGCLAGFGRAEEYAAPVGARVLDVLRGDEEGGRGPGEEAVLEWLEGRVEEEAQQEGGAAL